jgi:DNA recombination protein RmuC
MQLGLAGILPLVVALLMGIVGGAVLVNMLLGARVRALITDTSGSSGVETMGLNKLVPAESHPIVPDQGPLTELQTKLSATEVQLKTTEERCSILEEKCAQLADKSAQAEEKCAKLQEPSGSPAATPAQAEEQSSRISALQQEVSSLQSRLQEEEKRASTLSEEAARVPALEQKEKDNTAEIERLKAEKAARVLEQEQKQKDDSAQIDRMTQEIAEFREKWQASVGRIEEQQKSIERIEAEKAELFSKRDQLLQEHEGLRANLTDLNGLLDAERQHTAEKLVLLEKAKEQLSNTFKCLASEMVKEQAVGQS